MEILHIRNFNFKYPQSERFSLNNIDLKIEEGEFITVCGISGSGKTTLLRQLKPILSSHGEKTGEILYRNRNINELSRREDASLIGFVQQKPENQVVTDKVWHELAFGLESLGVDNKSIRLRVGEIASFFGIENWFHKKVIELSGGQLQILNLASIMAMQPEILILDEPTSQLDPIAANKFIRVLKKINIDLGTTILITEHRLEEAIPISDKIVILDGGSIIYNGKPNNLGEFFDKNDCKMIRSMPVPFQISSEIKFDNDTRITVKDGRQLVEKIVGNKMKKHIRENAVVNLNSENKISLNEIYFRYDKELPDVLKGVNLEVKKGEIFSILGGNGAGKSTILKLISKLNTPTRGKILLNGINLKKIKEIDLYQENLAMLPQNPQELFIKKTVVEDLKESIKDKNLSEEENNRLIEEITKKMKIDYLLESHPYDISGGEQQRVGLAKILLLNPKIILMDEPTKGMDGHFKEKFENILLNLRSEGKTIVIVSHDVEFCGEVSDRCALLFNGEIISLGDKNNFFNGNHFYTTVANKMCRNRIENIVTKNEAIKALTSILNEDKTICNS